MEALLTAPGLLSLATLTFLEIVLGIDNIIFISLVSNDLEESQQPLARRLGLALALGFRILMLLGITWLIGLTAPLFHLGDHAVSGRDAILFVGGVFLLAKSSSEIFKKTEGRGHGEHAHKPKSFVGVIIQIGLLDIVFSFDSVLTAIGMTHELVIMIVAVVISMVIMLTFAKPIAHFIEKHVSLQILALSFLIMIGTVLVAESAHVEIPKPYVYSSVGFALIVQLLSIRAAEKSKTTGSDLQA
jgi:predicted tellurium resistance membrane protein TerC